MTENQADLVGRTFRHFKMRLSPTAIRLADERSKELLHGKSRKSPRNLYRLEGFAKDSETLEEMVALEVCRRLTRRFTTDEKYIEGEIKNFGAYVQVFALVPEHITGKRVHEA